MEQKQFESIFKSYSPILYSFVKERVKDSQVAEDIVNETFLRFWGTKHKIECDKGIIGYLRMHARHATNNYLLNETKYTIDNIEPYVDSITWHQEEQINEQLILKLYTSIDTLPDRLKKIIQLSMAGYKPYEIAKKLGVTSHTVKTLKSHAYEFLRKDFLTKPNKDTSIIIQQVNILKDEINAELISYLVRNPHFMLSLDPYKFEKLVAELIRAMGYDVFLTQKTRDGGRDVIAVLNTPSKDKILTIIQCKRNSRERVIDLDIVKSFLFTIKDQDKANAGWIVTTSSFSRDARILQQNYKWQLSLKDNQHLTDWCSLYGQWTKSSSGGLWLPNNPLA